MKPRKLTLIDNVKVVILRAWSIRLAALSVVFSLLQIFEVLEVALPFLTKVLPPQTFAILAAIAAGGSMISRLYRQRNIP
jgi:hypothetical protein